MASKSKKRQLTPNTYKLIHSKSANLLVKKVAAELQKESEYFPGKITKKEMPNFFDPSNSLNLSNKQLSQSSRYISRNPHLGQSMKQQLNLRQKEIQALRRELKHVQKKALEKQDKTASIRKLESELAQTYRVIQFYEAKILQLQKICIMYEQSLDSTLRSTKHQKISLVLEEFRRENVELRIQLEQRMKANTLMTKQVGDLAVAKVQLEQKLKQLSKKMHNEMLIGSHTAKPKKFIDEYERQHLALANPNDSAKKRPLLPRKNKVKLTSGQSESEQSSIGAEYKNNIYVKRDFKRPTSKKDDSLQGRMKSKMYGNLSSKINSIEVEMQTLKKQNERLQQQLDIKLNDTFHIKKISQQLEMKVNVLEETIKLSKESKAERMPQKIVISKSMIKEIAKPQPEKSQSSKLPPSNPTQNKLSMFVSNISPHQSSISPSTSSQQVSGGKKAQIAKKPKKTNYQFIEIKQKTLRKLVIHLTKSEVAYESILDTLAQFWSGNDPNGLMGQLQNAPYNLSPQETAEFMFEYKQIIKYISGKESEQAIKDMNEEQYRKYISSEIKKVLEDNISCFKNITFRRQFSLNIQLANKFKNYESQFQQLANKYQNRIPFKECQQVFVKEWGLTEEQFMCLIVNNYEENGDLQFVQLEEIGRNYLSQ